MSPIQPIAARTSRLRVSTWTLATTSTTAIRRPSARAHAPGRSGTRTQRTASGPGQGREELLQAGRDRLDRDRREDQAEEAHDHVEPDGPDHAADALGVVEDDRA